jgi:ATP-dependent DNA helicase RecQ
MQFLDRQGVISLSQEFSEKVIIQFIIPSKEVIRYMSLNPNDEAIIVSILRNYTGIYEVATALNLSLISKKANTTEAEVIQLLQKLKDKAIIDYQAKNNDTVLIFNEVREDERTINRVYKYLENQNTLKKEQLKSVLNYVSDSGNCKSKLILSYFGEQKAADCGICSFCIAKDKPKVNAVSVAKQILNLLAEQQLNSREIQNATQQSTDDVIFALQNLLENNVIEIKSNNKYSLKS